MRIAKCGVCEKNIDEIEGEVSIECDLECIVCESMYYEEEEQRTI